MYNRKIIIINYIKIPESEQIYKIKRIFEILQKAVMNSELEKNKSLRVKIKDKREY